MDMSDFNRYLDDHRKEKVAIYKGLVFGSVPGNKQMGSEAGLHSCCRKRRRLMQAGLAGQSSH